MAQLALTANDIPPLLEGLAIMGTGGGGSPEWGRKILEQDLRMGRSWRVVPPEDLPDQATIICGGIMGSVKTLAAIGFDEVLERWERRFELLEVTREMERTLGRRIDAMVPFELGGLNTPIVFTLAARMGIAAVDGDALGRSAPETQMTSFLGLGVSLTPMLLLDMAGNLVVVQQAADPAYADELGRWVVTHGGGMGANNHYPMSGRQLKQVALPGTVGRALQLGREVMSARAAGQDPVAVVARELGGRLLFQGRVVALREEERMGFYFTTVTLTGAEGFAEHSARLIIKNETMLLFLDEKPAVMFPDLVCMLDPDSGRGVMSVELAEGMFLCLVAAACHPRLRQAIRTEAGRRAFAPARYGHPELSYRPMEGLLGQ